MKEWWEGKFTDNTPHFEEVCQKCGFKWGIHIGIECPIEGWRR